VTSDSAGKSLISKEVGLSCSYRPRNAPFTFPGDAASHNGAVTFGIASAAAERLACCGHYVDKGTLMTLRQIAFGFCVSVLAPGLATAQVALLKPSDSVIGIVQAETPCGGNGDGVIVDTRILADGNTVPFVIPAGYAFMVTGVDFVTGNAPGGGVPSGERIGYTLTTVTNDLIVAEGYAINSGAPGSVSGSTPISTPMPVTVPLCLHRTVGAVVGGTRTWVRGFLYRYF